MTQYHRRRLASSIAAAILIVSAFAAEAFGAEERSAEPAAASAKKKGKRRGFVVKRVNQISPRVRRQLRGNRGARGARGARGLTGPSTGPAGGDLQGAYPNPELADLVVSLPKLAPNSVNSARVIDNSLTAADINLASIGTFWRLGGNSGTDPEADFLGTLDDETFELRANGAPALRLVPATDGESQTPNVIGGVATNSVTPGVFGATISGGAEGTPGSSATANGVTDNLGTIGGGSNNHAGDGEGDLGDARRATVGGGGGNKASGENSTVGGGLNNDAAGDESTIAGGQSNEITDILSFIGGGFANEADRAATIAGGQVNEATGFESFIGGGQRNIADGQDATISGGFENVAGGQDSTVAGGRENAAGGFAATVGGGFRNSAAGSFSFVAGRRAKNTNAAHAGVFIFADSTEADIASTGANQFIARASGGFFLQDDSTIDDQGGFLNTSTGAHLTTGGAWTDSSDASLKQGFELVSPDAVLASLRTLPVSSWSYKAEPGVRHIGPTAQDFGAAFGLGADDRHVAALDANGVALAAIKALTQRLDRVEARLARVEGGGGER